MYHTFILRLRPNKTQIAQMELSTKTYQNHQGKDFTVYFRPKTSDERVLVEVVDKHVYRRSRIGFDVEPGETWLDLGANIGAFAVYCRTRGARSMGFEPDPVCFEILKKNIDPVTIGSEGYVNSAVTWHRQAWLQFWKGRRESDHYRGTIYPTKSMPKSEVVNNIHGSCLRNLKVDGVKIDIEGSEGGLIDDWLLPDCKKLCLEYHLSRDPSMINLSRRLFILQQKFDHVQYPAELDRLMMAKVDAKTFYDRMIFAYND